MKKIYYILLAFIAAMTLVSCEDFLTKPPQTALSPDSFFKNASDLELWTNKFYSDLLEDTDIAETYADDMMGTSLSALQKGTRTTSSKSWSTPSVGSDGYISDGSIIHVYDNQFMLLVDGGKVVDFTAEEGYYKVDNSSAPSLFAGQFGKSLADAFARIKFGGTPSYAQKAYFINLQEIKGIRFGTRTPVNYFDSFYNAELFLRAHGNYSIKITDPIKFYTEVIPKNADRVDIAAINEI